MTKKNGQLPATLRQFPPQIVRSLVDDGLPFNELDEILVALTVAEELEDDVLDTFGGIATGGEPFDTWATAVKIRKHYTERLRNLAERLKRGDEATITHVLADG